MNYLEYRKALSDLRQELEEVNRPAFVEWLTLKTGATSIYELGPMVGYSKTFFYTFLRGQFRLTLKTLETLEKYGISYDEFKRWYASKGE